MNLSEIKELVTLMNDNDLLELEVEDGDQKVRLRKLYEGVREKIVAIPSAPIAAISAGAVAPAAAAPEGGTVAAEGAQKKIPAPMVGTFYRAPSPDSPPYVEVGDVVTKDTVLCLVEAMKVMNEIKTECEGTITEVLVENGKAVEFGQAMFVVALG